MTGGRRFGIAGVAAAALVIAGGQDESRPRSVAVDTSQIANVAPVSNDLANSTIEVTVSRGVCRTNSALADGPNVMLTVHNEDSLPAVVSVDFVRTPAVEGHSSRAVTLPLRSGQLALSCALIPLNRSSPVVHGTTAIKVVT